jgi:hypothetical protein
VQYLLEEEASFCTYFFFSPVLAQDRVLRKWGSVLEEEACKLEEEAFNILFAQQRRAKQERVRVPGR